MISNMIDTGGGGSNILYDSGVLTAAATTITIPDSVTTGLTSLTIKMTIANAVASRNQIRLFVNSDTTVANYGFTNLGTQGSTPYGTGANAGIEIMHTRGAVGIGMCRCDVEVIDSLMWFSSDAINGLTSSTREKDQYGGTKHTGTITDLSGMSIVSQNADDIGIGSRIIILAN